MSYTALYRKWRPDNFDDVKGQDHIVETLKNQIKSDRIGHAYLFCGTRGTGKTTIAKILARAVNCEHPVDGSPCGECAVCKAIASGASLNVIEIDAASNNGVDNIRQIREEVAYRPTEGRYKVYIIDEVHMLSIGAFNALLKTLEEPPAYVIFILATTESHKIPVTIMSRCQRYDFKRISVETITDRLSELVKAENANVEEKALRYIAKMADGAMRDALSLLDQCMSFYMDRELKYEDVLEVLGTVDTDVFSGMLRLVIDGKVTELISTLDELILQGRDISQFVSDFTWYLRNLLLLRTSAEAEAMIDMSAENIERLKEEAAVVDEDTLMRYIRILSELSASLRSATQKRVMAEVALIRMTRPQMDSDTVSLTQRLERIEKLVGEKEDIIALTAIRPETPVTYVQNETPASQPPRKHMIKALSEDLTAVRDHWSGIVAQMSQFFEQYLLRARVTVEDDALIIIPANGFDYAYLNGKDVTGQLKTVISDTIGKDVDVRLMKPGDKGADEEYEDIREFKEQVRFDVKIED
ncbi:MAG: DNA polymerase III subunit gamma/tau [Butyrivibrio sp.]